MEFAVSTRIAIHLARSSAARKWEREFGVTVDAEYFQEGADGKHKGGRDEPMKPDVIIHRRTETVAQWNWMICEIKLYEHSKPLEIDPGDRDKLMRCVDRFGYQLAVWVSLPRTLDVGDHAYYSKLDGQFQPSPIRVLV